MELSRQWERAVEFMQTAISLEPEYRDLYIYMNFLLMNLLINRDLIYRDKGLHDYYTQLLRRYFRDSYLKYSNNAEYMFCTGIIASMSISYMGINSEDCEKMLTRALELDPNNILYQQTYYRSLNKNIPEQLEEARAYASLVLQEKSMLVLELKSRGALGEYLYGILHKWALEILQDL